MNHHTPANDQWMRAFVVCAAAALASLACASGAGRAVVPTGIRNTGNFCYMAAMLQALFWIPEVREHVLAPVGERQPGAVHLALAQLFMRMQAAGGRAVSPRDDLLPVVARVLAAEGEMVTAGVADDPDAFFRLLVKHVFVGLPADVLGVRVQQAGVIGVPGRDDVALRMASVLLPPSEGAQVNVNDARGVPVHELLVRDAENTLTYKPADFLTLVHPVDAAGRHVAIGGLPPAVSGTLALERLGVPIGTELSVYFQQRLVGPLPKVLMISAAKFGYSERRGATWDKAAPTVFAQRFELTEHDARTAFPASPEALFRVGLTGALGLAQRDETPGRRVAYALHEIVFHVPAIPHYVAAVCTDPATDGWTLFDDDSATPLAGPPLLDAATGRVRMTHRGGHRVSGESSRQPYILVYARTDATQAWADAGAPQRFCDFGVWPAAVAAEYAAAGNIHPALERALSLSYEQALARGIAEQPPARQDREALFEPDPDTRYRQLGALRGDTHESKRVRRQSARDGGIDPLFDDPLEADWPTSTSAVHPQRTASSYDDAFSSTSPKDKKHKKSKKSKKHRKHKSHKSRKSHKKRRHSSSSSSSSASSSSSSDSSD